MCLFQYQSLSAQLVLVGRFPPNLTEVISGIYSYAGFSLLLIFARVMALDEFISIPKFVSTTPSTGWLISTKLSSSDQWNI